MSSRFQLWLHSVRDSQNATSRMSPDVPDVRSEDVLDQIMRVLLAQDIQLASLAGSCPIRNLLHQVRLCLMHYDMIHCDVIHYDVIH